MRTNFTVFYLERRLRWLDGLRRVAADPDSQSRRGAYSPARLRNSRVRDDDDLRIYQTALLDECVVGNTVYPAGGIVYLSGFGFDREVCECARRDFLRQLTRRSMRTQRTLRSEDSLLPFVTIRPDSAD